MDNGVYKYKICIYIYEKAGLIVVVKLQHVALWNVYKNFLISHGNKDYQNLDFSLD